MNNFKKNEKSEFERVVDYLTTNGDICFPTDNISSWVNSIEEKTNLCMHIPKAMNTKVFSSIDQYLEEYHKTARCSMHRIPNSALEAILDGISYVNMRECVLNEAELAVLMITQLLRIHCIVVYSKNILVRQRPFKKNYELRITYNNSFQRKNYKCSVIRM